MALATRGKANDDERKGTLSWDRRGELSRMFRRQNREQMELDWWKEGFGRDYILMEGLKWEFAESGFHREGHGALASEEDS